MSNQLAFATVSFVLQQRLNQVVGSDVSSATATNTRPDGTGASPLPAPGVNIYLLQATYNGPMSDPFLPTMSADATRVARPVGAFDLTYMFTFHGDDSKWEPQRVQASVLRHIHTNPEIGKDTIRSLISALPGTHALKKSDLADQFENVKLTPAKMTLDDLSKIWSVFFQKPYALTSIYYASVVLLESDISTEASLPILKVVGDVTVMSDVRIDSIDPPMASVSAGTKIVLAGINLLGDNFAYQVGGVDATVDIANSTSSSVTVSLGAGLLSGPATVVVQKPSPFGAGHVGANSNVATVQLFPAVNTITFTPAAGPTPAQFDVTLTPNVELAQTAALVLNRLTPPSAGKPWSYLLPATPRSAATGSLNFVSLGVEAGDYLYRVRIDGVDTPLSFNGTSYDGPKVTVT
ncbi:MAG: DUF4255 domain-containing protein [Armatimonadetes bacterium]|nr:DUF4255 domain-containing protein [Armatimonadota bacterium]